MHGSGAAGPVLLRRMERGDWPDVARIYGEGIATGDATFESEVPPWEGWDADHLEAGRIVACRAGAVAGWAALSRVSARRAYAGVAEVSVYVGRAHRGLGIGRRLLAELVAQAEGAGIWTLQAGIFPENRASIHLHEAGGFRTVGIREGLGRSRDGKWRDVVLMERRSRRL